MRVLIACEFSGITREAFRSKGIDAVSIDLLPSALPGKHIQDDVLNHLNDGFDMMIAFPPCTHLAVCGARVFYRKTREQAEALQFVRRLMAAPIKRICIENPVSMISTRIRPPDQVVHPYYFGDAYPKKTCLWLKNLPVLQWFGPGTLFPGKYVEPVYYYYNSITIHSGKSRYSYQGKLGSGTGLLRSITPNGLAQAMAEQWSHLL